MTLQERYHASLPTEQRPPPGQLLPVHLSEEVDATAIENCPPEVKSFPFGWGARWGYMLASLGDAYSVGVLTEAMLAKGVGPDLPDALAGARFAYDRYKKQSGRLTKAKSLERQRAFTATKGSIQGLSPQEMKEIAESEENA